MKDNFLSGGKMGKDPLSYRYPKHQT